MKDVSGSNVKYRTMDILLSNINYVSRDAFRPLAPWWTTVVGRGALSLMASPVVKLHVLHVPTGMTVMEKRYQLSQSVDSIKANLANFFQTAAHHMILVLKDETGTVVDGNLLDSKPLGYYQVPAEGWSLEVHDDAPAETKAAYYNTTDVHQVEKYEIPEEEYLKRPSNIRALRAQREQALREAMISQGLEPRKALDDDSFKDIAEAIHVGDRCQVFPGDRLATVRYVGRIALLKPGFWVGVEYDEPVGKNDGSIMPPKGTGAAVRVFECRPMHGGFVRPEHVTVGDYPPEEF